MHPERERELLEVERLMKRGVIAQLLYDRWTGKTLPEWFTERIDFATGQTKYGTTESELWHRLAEQYAEGDELWEYRMPEHLRGRGSDEKGLALVRNGEVIDSVAILIHKGL